MSRIITDVRYMNTIITYSSIAFLNASFVYTSHCVLCVPSIFLIAKYSSSLLKVFGNVRTTVYNKHLLTLTQLAKLPTVQVVGVKEGRGEQRNQERKSRARPWT